MSSTTGATYRITLYLDSMTYKIYNVGSERIVSKGGCKTAKGLKEKAKRHIKKLGVKFTQEIRGINIQE